MGGWIGLFDLWGKRKRKKEKKRKEKGGWMIYEACFDSRRGCGNDVNCFIFFSVKIAGDGTRWKLEMKVGDRIYLMAGVFHFFAYGYRVVRTR